MRSCAGRMSLMMTMSQVKTRTRTMRTHLATILKKMTTSKKPEMTSYPLRCERCNAELENSGPSARETVLNIACLLLLLSLLASVSYLAEQWIDTTSIAHSGASLSTTGVCGTALRPTSDHGTGIIYDLDLAGPVRRGDLRGARVRPR